MMTNLQRYEQDLDKLIGQGNQLEMSMQLDVYPDKFKEAAKKELRDNADDFLRKLPKFSEDYQTWYSETKVLIKLLLPDRLDDFTRHYEKPKPRKEITCENYCIEDYLQHLNITRGWEKIKVVGPDAAIPHFKQQQAILKSVKARFKSSLFDIAQLVQADLFDSELAAAAELAKHKFLRAAGAVAGVVLERHLKQVCENHNIKITKKAPGISDLNNLLKESNVIDVPQWRFIQHLGDLRNLCDHSKTQEPTNEQISDLVSGVTKISKTIF